MLRVNRTPPNQEAPVINPNPARPHQRVRVADAQVAPPARRRLAFEGNDTPLKNPQAIEIINQSTAKRSLQF